MNSAIEKLIRADDLIIICKKQAKTLSRDMNKPLMECQNIIAKKMGHYDWHALYSKIKEKHTEQFNPIENLIINSLINNHKNICFRFHDNENLTEITNEHGITNTHASIDKTFDYLNFFMKKNNKIVVDLLDYSSFKFSYHNGKKTIGYLHYQSVPRYPNGFHIYIGLNLIQNTFLSLTELGFSREQIEVLMKAKGLVLFCSNRTQDKFSAIDSFVNEIAQAAKNEMKIIKFSEYKQEHLYLNKYPAFEQYKNLEKNIEETLSAKPDLVRFSQIREKNTAKIIINTSKKVPLTIASINAGSALLLFDRLDDFNVKKIEESNLSTCVHQIELPRLCDHCKIKESKDMDYSLKFLPEIINLINKTYLYSRGIGCKHCSNGIKGLNVCAEIVELNSESWKFIKDKGLEAFKKYWHTLHDQDIFSTNILGKTAYDNAIRKMLEGKLSSQDLVCQYGYLYKPHL